MAISGLAELESEIGHQFRSPGLLLQALTHSSRLPERSSDDPPADNERLEFLGDAVLELLVSEELIRIYPEWNEGQLSKSRARLVNATSLCAAAQRLGLGNYLRLGRGEEKTGGRTKPALLADAYEAVVAAIYLDAGLESVRAFVQRTLVDAMVALEAEFLGRSDYKSALQEWLQAQGKPPGDYRVVEETGPDHEKTFRVQVNIAGEIAAVGVGKSKKEAEQVAALAALTRLGAVGNGKGRTDV
jgi:ribonuclease III